MEKLKGTSPPLKKLLNIPEIYAKILGMYYVPLITFVTFYQKIMRNVEDIDFEISPKKA